MSLYCVAETSTEANPLAPVSLYHFVPARGARKRSPCSFGWQIYACCQGNKWTKYSIFPAKQKNAARHLLDSSSVNLCCLGGCVQSQVMFILTSGCQIQFPVTRGDCTCDLRPGPDKFYAPTANWAMSLLANGG